VFRALCNALHDSDEELQVADGHRQDLSCAFG
jgi:hypothetical protein